MISYIHIHKYLYQQLEAALPFQKHQSNGHQNVVEEDTIQGKL